MPAQQNTAQLIQDLCEEIGHSDAAVPCVKKIVQENQLEELDKLHYVPSRVLEDWGVPLKLCHLIYDHIHERSADEIVGGVTSFVNYNLRPSVLRVAGPALDYLQKQTNPETWAAVRLQRAYRRYQRQKLQKDLVQIRQLEVLAAAQSALDKKEFRNLSESKRRELRKARAEETLRLFVRRWKAKRAGRKARQGSQARDDASKLDENWDGIDLVQSLTRLASDKDMSCEVAELLFKLGGEVLQEREVKEQVQHLVVENWLEDISDLALVRERHWKAWRTPVVAVRRMQEAAYREATITRMEKSRNGCQCVLT